MHRLFLSLAMAAALCAQAPDLKAILNLSDPQVLTLVQLQQQKAATLQPLLQQIQQHEQMLDQVLETNPDPAVVGGLVIEMTLINRQVEQASSNFQQKAFSILQPDQRTQVQSLGNVLRLQSAAQQAVALGLLSPPK